MLLIGSPTKLNKEKDTKATTSITNADWNSLLKKYFINFRKLRSYRPLLKRACTKLFS
tara:strand:- start:587 stop:760 length:174 start_codon:yes stop_codon:yes gene_type:complete